MTFQKMGPTPPGAIRKRLSVRGSLRSDGRLERCADPGDRDDWTVTRRSAGFGKKVRTMFDRLYETDFAVLYPMTIVLITGAAEVGAWLGWRSRRDAEEMPETGTLTGAALGLLALLLAFSFSLALSRYEARLQLGAGGGQRDRQHRPTSL